MRILFIVITLISCNLGVVAFENYAFIPISANNGLSNNQVRNIAQLPDGRMMIATEGMLNLYDGTAFSYLHYSDKNSVPLSEYSGFHHDYISADGYMWLKNQHRLYLIDIVRERFVDSPAKFLKSMGFSTPLKDFFMDQEKSLWLITQDDNLYYVRKAKKQLFKTNVSKHNGNQDQVYDLAVADHKLYLFFRSGMLSCFDIKSQKELYRLQSFPGNVQEQYGSTSFVMPSNDSFFQLRNGPAGGIMLRFNPSKKNWTTVLKTGYWLNYLSIDKTENLWLTCKEGMWRFKSDLSQKEFIPNLNLVDGQIINTELSTIYHDHTGGMWLGTLNRGLLYYHPERFKFRNIGKVLFGMSSSASLNVSCFAEDLQGQLLVGTQQGLFEYNAQTKSIRQSLLPISRQSCNGLLRDARNRIWIATNGNGLYCIHPKGQLQHYHSAPKTIYSVIENPDGTLYLGTDRDGFGLFDPVTDTYRQETISREAALHSVSQLAYLTKNVLAGLYRNGFFLYDIESRKIKKYADSHGYNALLADAEGKIWLGSKDGLHIWNSKAGKKQSFYTQDGLINNYIQSILQTADGTIWVSTSNGISQVIDRKNGQYSFINFNRVDGVIENEFWQRSAYISKSGNLFWGGTDGFNELITNRLLLSKPSSAPLLVAFHLFNKKVESGQKYDGNLILESPITLSSEITLNYDQNFISLEFTALNYINPSQSYYRYQLSGIDKGEQEIQSTDGRGRATYTNLQPGTYYFKVRTANNSRDWTSRYRAIKIVVKAPLWKTPFAYFLYFLLSVGVIALGIRTYLSRKRKKLIQEQKEKLNEMKTAFLHNVNEELGQPLHQIIQPLDNILKHTDEGRIKLQLNEVRNHAEDLKALIHQLSEEVLAPVPEKENALNMDVLILNMRKLLERQQERKESAPEEKNDPSAAETLLSAFDEKLIQRALKYVEANLDNPDYSVELLSRDMGMDRTGLYRKLVHIIGKTPTTFIRSVRMKRAAVLLEEGFTVNEVADRVGFSTASYLSKCFQEEFGMKPSQYLASLKEGKKPAKD